MASASCGCPVGTAGVNHDATCVLHPTHTWRVIEQPFACPVCHGQKTVSRPPWVAGDVDGWASNTTGTFPCPTCDATGIVWRAPRA